MKLSNADLLLSLYEKLGSPVRHDNYLSWEISCDHPLGWRFYICWQADSSVTFTGWDGHNITYATCFLASPERTGRSDLSRIAMDAQDMSRVLADLVSAVNAECDTI